MNKTLKNKGRVLLALLLSAVLYGILLIKPAHILLVHHELTELAPVHPDRITLSNLHHHECAICDFEFCSFISQSQVSVPKVLVAFANEPALQTIDCITDRTSYHFQLRAPPVF